MLAASASATMSRTTARDSAMPEAMTACPMRKIRKTVAFGANSVPSVARRNRINDPISTLRRP